MMKKIVIGTFAHVDAGKTTLSEILLYRSGAIRTQGRVDHGNSHLDTESMEKERGITIFSNMSPFTHKNTYFTLLDTPGHADFSSETERVMPIIDYAILLISGTDLVQAHTETLWSILSKYHIPVFIFVSKMDISYESDAHIIAELRNSLHPNCHIFNNINEEELALSSEDAMTEFISSNSLSDETIQNLICERSIFPVFFGSGLKGTGIDEFLDALDRFTKPVNYETDFAAKVFKISRDHSGSRLTFLKVTGGSLSVRTPLSYQSHNNEFSEKIHQIRVYSGDKYETINEAYPGDVVAVTGLDHTYPGLGLGSEANHLAPYLTPVISCKVVSTDGTDSISLLKKLRVMEEEDPLLHVVWNELQQEILIQIMGSVQIEVLKQSLLQRFGISVDIGEPEIMYRETIESETEGIGHFEPLRHYAEVHVVLSPLPRGSGLIFESDCSEDILDRNWQRLILSHMEEKEHLGVLTGSPITDLKITLIAGRAHKKHTEGGDFRQATYRAIRQGLRTAKSILLEPYYSFAISCPVEISGRVISDIKLMDGSISDTVISDDGTKASITGRASVKKFGEYATVLSSISHGKGHINQWLDGYEPCCDQTNRINERGYDPDADINNPCDSVFCSHGSSLVVPWNEVSQYMHINTGFGKEKELPVMPVIQYRNLNIDDKELEEIMNREFGPIRRPVYSAKKTISANTDSQPVAKKNYLIIDGYNVIFGWDELKEIAESDISSARSTLLDILANYHGYTSTEVLVVFDAYRVQGNSERSEDYHGVHVVYTKQRESADAHIQQISHEIGKNYSVRIVTSDSLIQLTALGSGVLRVSTREFRREVNFVMEQINTTLSKSNKSILNTKIGDLYGK